MSRQFLFSQNRQCMDEIVNASSISSFYNKLVKTDLSFALFGIRYYSTINLYYAVFLFLYFCDQVLLCYAVFCNCLFVYFLLCYVTCQLPVNALSCNIFYFTITTRASKEPCLLTLMYTVAAWLLCFSRNTAHD